MQNGASEHKDHIGMPSILARLINGILLPKLFWPTMKKNCSSDRKKLLGFRNMQEKLEKYCSNVGKTLS